MSGRLEVNTWAPSWVMGWIRRWIAGRKGSVMGIGSRELSVSGIWEWRLRRLGGLLSLSLSIEKGLPVDCAGHRGQGTVRVEYASHTNRARRNSPN